MIAQIVIGLGFGDEGKGLVTDFLCNNHYNPIVVRFSGGQQAGHTVIRGETRHVFSNYGSGTLQGAPSYFSEHTCIYPNTISREREVLKSKGVDPKLYVHPLAKVTTIFDVAWNKATEVRGKNHGTVGLGIGATFSRNIESGHKLFAMDLFGPKELLKKKLEGIALYYSKKIGNDQNLSAEYIRFLTIEIEKECTEYPFEIKNYDFLRSFNSIIFEGSQGIMLDMDHGIFPNVTYANTTSKNAIEICKKLSIDYSVWYATRCYQTRHGNGYMSNEKTLDLIHNEKETNVPNEWQGTIRTGELDYELLDYALSVDDIYQDKKLGYIPNLVVTCLDQRPSFIFDKSKLNHNFGKILYSESPDSQNLH